MPTLSVKNAALFLLIVFGVVFLYHISILTGLVPADSVWGGKVANDQLVYFESVALVLLLLFGWVVAAKAGLISSRLPSILLKVGPWIVFTYMIINTAGNLLAPGWEKLFALVTFFLSLCAFIVATSKPPT